MTLRSKAALPLTAAALLALSILSGCSFDKPSIGTGSLMVKSTAQAMVEVDHTVMGTTNKKIDSISADSHVVSVLSDGRTLFEADVVVKAGDGLTVVDVDATTDPVQDLQDEAQNKSLDSALVDPADEFADEVQALRGTTVQVSVTVDFPQRDKLPQTNAPRSQWASYGSWGPPAAIYPAPKLTGSSTADWKRQRVVAVAKKYMGLPYKHVHIPAMGGLDCSNFTSWVYNYGLGVKFTSAVADQGATVGRTVSKSALLPGDLVYFKSGGTIVHTAIFAGNGYIIDDSTMNGGGGKVAMKKLNTGWPASHFAYAKRVI